MKVFILRRSHTYVENFKSLFWVKATFLLLADKKQIIITKTLRE